MLKKMTVLAMAVGVVAALALPATASATWKQGHETPLAANETINFTGNAAFTSSLGGVTCQVTSETQFIAGQTSGEVETFDVHPQDETTNCKGTGGLSPCQVHDVTPQTGLNWGFHTTQTAGPPVTQHNTVQITTQSLQSTLTGAFCLVKHINLTPGSVTATPNQPTTVTSLTLSGGLKAHIQTNNGTTHQVDTTVSHSLTIEDAADKHKFSI
jgi:hypothetical protein